MQVSRNPRCVACIRMLIRVENGCTCGAGPFLVAFKAFAASKNKLTKYRCTQAETVVEHTVSTNRGAHGLCKSNQHLVE